MVIKNWSSNLLVKRIQLNKSIRMGVCFMKDISIEERAINLAQYIIDSKDTVRGASKKFGISKSTVHMEVTIQNGLKIGQKILENV